MNNSQDSIAVIFFINFKIYIYTKSNYFHEENYCAMIPFLTNTLFYLGLMPSDYWWADCQIKMPGPRALDRRPFVNKYSFFPNSSKGATSISFPLPHASLRLEPPQMFSMARIDGCWYVFTFFCVKLLFFQ